MISYDLPPAFMAIFIFLYGAVLGSFLTVCVHRFPPYETVFGAWRSLTSPLSSYCDRCKTPLPVKDNVPILGWLWLRGRCRFCKRGIPSKYPLIELANGLLFVLVYFLEVPQGRLTQLTESCLNVTVGSLKITDLAGPMSVAAVNWRFVYHVVLIEALLVASLIDWERMIIPDSVTLPPMVVAVAGAAVFGNFWLVPVWTQDPVHWNSLVASVTGAWPKGGATSPVPTWILHYPRGHALSVSIVGWLVGGGVIWVIRLVGHAALKREAMGFGDVVLMAMVGAFLGWQPTVVAIVIAAFLSVVLILAMRLFAWNREIPFGPFLSLGTLIVLLGWKWIWIRFEPLFSNPIFLGASALFLPAGMFVMLLVIRAIRRLFGWSPDDVFVNDEWTSADHLFYFSGETIDRHQGQWRRDSWPGESAGRGQLYWEQWRRPR